MSDVADYTNQPVPIPREAPGMHDLVIADVTQAWANTPSLIGSNEERGIVGIIEEFETRKEFGLKKYGTLLQANNGRDPFRDALDEALDLIVYIKQILTEQVEKPLELEEAKRASAMDRMYRDALEMAIGLKYFLLEREKKDDCDNGDSTEAGSPDLAG